MNLQRIGVFENNDSLEISVIYTVKKDEYEVEFYKDDELVLTGSRSTYDELVQLRFIREFQ
jgi:hypothetical protein